MNKTTKIESKISYLALDHSVELVSINDDYVGRYDLVAEVNPPPATSRSGRQLHVSLADGNLTRSNQLPPRRGNANESLPCPNLQ